MKKPLKAEVNDLIKRINKGVKFDSLSIFVIDDISSTLFSFKPYKYLNEEKDELNSLPCSPEKSRVLLHLLSLGLKKKNLV